MKNFIQSGDVITVAAPYAVAGGAGAMLGLLFGVAQVTFAQTEVGAFVTEGVFDLAGVSADTGSVGDKVFWDDSAKVATTATATGLFVIGCLTAAKLDAELTVRVRLNGLAATAV